MNERGGRGCADGRVGPWTLERWAVAARVGPGTGCCLEGAGAGGLALGQRSVVDGVPGCGVRVSRGRGGAWPCPWGRSVRCGKRGQGCGGHLRAGLSLLQPGLQPGRVHALPGWVGDSESMGGRAMGAGGGLCLQGPEKGAMLGGKVPESYRNLPTWRRWQPPKRAY